jgi:cytochrome c5
MAGQKSLSAFHQEQARLWGKPVPPHIRHHQRGRSRYVYGCTCELCIPPGLHPGGPRLGENALTGAERRKRSREKLRGKPVPSHVKHGIYAAQVYRCPCDVCHKAKLAQREAQRNRWRETSHGHWVDLPSGFTVLHWPPANAQPGWECPECGEVPS